MASTYSNHAASYLESGLSVIPCAPGTKFPGKYTPQDGWRAAFDWQKFCGRMPSGFETGIWERWPDAGICLVLGAASGHDGLHLVALDIDTDEPDEVAAIRSVLPGSPCVKRGAKGETQFYLASAAVVSKPFNDGNKRRMLDLLASGRQTVMPPTFHPDCKECGSKGVVLGDGNCKECGSEGRAYVWLSPDTLESFPVKDLPVLPDDIAARLSKALEPFGFEESAGPADGPADPNAEASTHRQLNDAALANLPAWVPALGLYKCRQVGGKYKAVAVWRPSSGGRPDSQRATNLIISSDGIRDKGAEQGYTPIDLVMAACEADLDTAFRWLQEHVAPAPVVVLHAKGPSETVAPVAEHVPNRTRSNLAGLHLAAVDGEILPEAVENEEGAGETDDAPEPTGTVIPADLCTPPGLIGDIVSWMNACSPVPSPQLNLSIALTFLGAVYGRRFEAPTGARSNLYCIGVADSGFGKSFPLKCINSIERGAGLERFFGPAGLKSDSALRKLLERQNPVFISVDEIGELFSKILNRRAGSHEVGLRELLLALFSSADDVYRGSEGAAEKAQPIYNPHLNLFGMSTPSAFWSAFSSANAENGLLPRILIFDAGEREPDEVTPTCDRNEVPRDICKALHATLDARPVGNIAGAMPSARVSPIRASYAPGAEEMFIAIREEMKARRRRTDGLEKLAYSRFAEHVIKLSLIYSIGINPTAPEISIAGLQWASEIVDYTTRALLNGAVDRVADSEYDAAYKRVRRIAKDASGQWGITTKALKKIIGGTIKGRDLDDIIKHLESAGEIQKFVGSGPKGGKPTERVRALSDVAEAS